MAASRRETNTIKTRTRILKASRLLFKEKGYESTMIDEVAEKAEVSKATLYNYFPNKESLLLGTTEDELKTMHFLIETEFAHLENSEQKLRRVLEYLIIDSSPYIELSRKITYLNSCEDHALYKTRLDMINLYKDLIIAAQSEGIFKKEIPPDDITDLVMGAYFISQFNWAHVDAYSSEFCKEKLNHLLDKMFAAVYE
jgi:AcrR family transcriptional regulator